MAEPKKRPPRARRRLAVRFGAPGDLSHQGLTVNVSPRGIGISSSTVYAAGTPLVLELSLPSGEPSRLAGVVIWATRGTLALNLPGTMGIRIDAPDQAFLRLAEQLMVQMQGTDPAVIPPGAPTPDADWWQDPGADLDPPASGQRRSGVSRVPRFFEHVPVRFGSTPQLDQRGFTENISRTGMAIACSAGLTPGDTLLFALTLPDERLCHGTGSVMWSRLAQEDRAEGHLMGIRITRVEKTFKDLLEALARRH